MVHEFDDTKCEFNSCDDYCVLGLSGNETSCTKTRNRREITKHNTLNKGFGFEYIEGYWDWQAFDKSQRT